MGECVLPHPRFIDPRFEKFPRIIEWLETFAKMWMKVPSLHIFYPRSTEVDGSPGRQNILMSSLGSLYTTGDLSVLEGVTQV